MWPAAGSLGNLYLKSCIRSSDRLLGVGKPAGELSGWYSWRLGLRVEGGHLLAASCADRAGSRPLSLWPERYALTQSFLPNRSCSNEQAVFQHDHETDASDLPLDHSPMYDSETSLGYGHIYGSFAVYLRHCTCTASMSTRQEQTEHARSVSFQVTEAVHHEHVALTSSQRLPRCPCQQ